jgi:alkyl hydroperoxide reductase subunit AhpC
MLPGAVSGDPTSRSPAENQTVRNVFVIGPDKPVKLLLVYPMTTGRNFDEILTVGTRRARTSGSSRSPADRPLTTPSGRRRTSACCAQA